MARMVKVWLAECPVCRWTKYMTYHQEAALAESIHAGYHRRLRLGMKARIFSGVEVTLSSMLWESGEVVVQTAAGNRFTVLMGTLVVDKSDSVR